ncbi:hypothetical protein MCOR29_011249 [Pyricularia oryzae]|nr:hypothetical protein MCOR19_008697 [Pyricularia oryzae]KAI6266995.1 hypothetical protein MCOR26_009915 [Pyricularia oryzae]KAI6296652.1 hypothetical protein MCOR29_011249 [Pyricularia oryzae]KAI6335076.1 hypothetical protein MCOR28_009810 [Pyricularia oryzae]KAI6360374.1 hypothetical protein MCOR31_009104 [Pyricularia oryzae]
MLFNTETSGVMMIDFERALLLEPPRPPLVQLVSNKRKRKPDVVYSSKSWKPVGRSQVGRVFSEDLGLMKMAFDRPQTF